MSAPEAQPARDGRIDERVTAVEQRMHEMSQRLDKVGGQVQSLEGGVAGAQSRADSLEVYCAPDSIELSDAAQTALAAVVREMEANPALTVELGGYTDPRGAVRLMVDQE